MNISESFPIEIHQKMLRDQVRNQAYSKAIRSTLVPGETTVEIGTGTGILTQFALLAGAAQVHTIEYFSKVSKIAASFLEQSKHQIQFINSRSYDVTLYDSPRTLVTETIGQIGPEENIVELCFDFKRRHPSIEQILPYELSVFAQPIWSSAAKTYAQSIVDDFCSAFDNTSYVNTVKTQILEEISNQIHTSDLNDSTEAGKTHLLAQYRLGTDSNSRFNKTLDISSIAEGNWNAVHLFFRAQLTPEIELSTHFSKPSTHWGHSFVLKPKTGKARLNISFVPGTQAVTVNWI